MVFPPSGNGPGGVEIDVRIRANEQELNRTKRGLENFKKSLGDATSPERARELQRIAKEFAALRDSGVSAGHATLQLKNRLAEVSATKQEIAVVKAEYDRLNKAIVTTRKEATQTAKEAERAAKEAAKAVQESAKLVEPAIPTARRGAALQAFGREARLSVPAFPIPGTNLSTEFLFRVGEVAGRLNLNFKDLAIAGGAASAAIIGISLALKNFDDTLRPITEQLNGIVFGRSEAAGILASEGPQGVLDRIDQTETELRRQRAERDSLAESLATERAALGLPGPDDTALTGGKTALDLIIASIAGSFGPINDQQAALDKLNGEITKNENLLDGLRTQYEDVNEQVVQEERIKKEQVIALNRGLAANQANLAVRNLEADAIRDSLEAFQLQRDGLMGLINSGKLSAEQTEGLWRQIEQLSEQTEVYKNALPRAEEVERLAQAEEDRKEAQQQLIQLSERALQIQAAGEDRIAAIRERGNEQVEAAEERLSDARQKLVDFNTDLEEKRGEINASFMADDLERVTDFRRRERRIERDADRERLRDLEDHQQNLLDAEAANDVTAFLQEQRRFNTEQRRKAEDERTAADDRLDDLETERQKAREVRDEKLQALDAEANKKRADLNAEIAERESALQKVKDQIAERVAAEQAAIQQSLENLVRSFDTSTQAMSRTLQDAFRILEAAGVASIGGIIEDLQQRANLTAATAFIQPTYGTPLQSSLLGSGGPDTGTVIPFARGGIVDRPTRALIGDSGPGMSEAIIPFRRSDGIEAAIARLGIGSSSQGMVFDFSGANFGSMTPTDVETIVRREIVPVVRAQANALRAARVGRSA